MQQSELIVDTATSLLKDKDFVLIAVDGRCGAGKSTLAAELQKKIDCNVLHMDDFFLQPHQRTKQRLSLPGENVDHERFLQEVLIPLKKNRAFSFRPYSCKTGSLGRAVYVEPKPITVVEGSYSCHPDLWDYYDLHVFVDIDAKTQMERIIARNGIQAAEVFKSKWIPMEEEYFSAFDIQMRCEIQV